MIFIISDIINVEAFPGHLPSPALEEGLRQVARITSLHLSVASKIYCCILSLLKFLRKVLESDWFKSSPREHKAN